jgi:hypothetical protein
MMTMQHGLPRLAGIRAACGCTLHVMLMSAAWHRCQDSDKCRTLDMCCPGAQHMLLLLVSRR